MAVPVLMAAPVPAAAAEDRTAAEVLTEVIAEPDLMS
jgi:hypothetical protein